MEPTQAVVAIVDDDAAVCRALRRLVILLGYEATTFPSGEALLEGLDAALPTHILLDLHMPGLHGPSLVEKIRALAKDARVVVMTGLEMSGAREASLAAGADLFVRKPLKPADLHRILGGTSAG